MNAGPSLLLACGLVAAGCTRDTVHAGPLEIRGAFAFAPITLESTGAYLTIINHGTTSDTLVSVRCTCARAATLHQSGPGGMVPRASVPIPAGDSLRMVPGGMHLMLTSLDHRAKPGERLTLVLRFARAGDVTLEVPVRPYAE